MATINIQRQEMIRRAVTQRPDAVLEVTVHLWERLAYELISIIGEGGFQSLYSRSVLLTSAAFPWMVLSHPWQRTDSRFEDLKIGFEGKDVTQTSEASVTLLTTFIDILAVLIGELLTTSILRSAWGDDALGTAAKEIDHE